MSGVLLRWRTLAPPVMLRWRGPSGALKAISRTPLTDLTGFVVPSASANVSGGDGIDVIGNDIRINIDELPLAPGV